jgi:hypothetical protein
MELTDLVGEMEPTASGTAFIGVKIETPRESNKKFQACVISDFSRTDLHRLKIDH